MPIEIKTEEIQNFLGHDATLSDLEDFVSATFDQQTSNRPKTKEKSNLPHKDVFLINQSDYIDYLIHKRINRIRTAKKAIFWTNIREFIKWLFKTIIAIIAFLFCCWGFYLLVWYMQNSLLFYRENIPTIP